MSAELNKTRVELAQKDRNEHDLREEFPMVMMQWAKMQEIITARNVELETAISVITEKYASQIEKAENEYAFCIKMASS
jgi:hypothetical protein